MDPGPLQHRCRLGTGSADLQRLLGWGQKELGAAVAPLAHPRASCILCSHFKLFHPGAGCICTILCPGTCSHSQWIHPRAGRILCSMWHCYIWLFPANPPQSWLPLHYLAPCYMQLLPANPPQNQLHPGLHLQCYMQVLHPRANCNCSILCHYLQPFTAFPPQSRAHPAVTPGCLTHRPGGREAPQPSPGGSRAQSPHGHG